MLETFYNLLGFNRHLFIIINDATNIGILPNILQAISSIFFIANFAAGYLMACIYFYYKTKKAADQTGYFTPVYYELTRIGINYALFGLVFAALKFSVNLPRPFCSLLPTEFVTITDTSIERCLSSFPSAHTGLSLLVAYCFWPYMNKTLKTFACLAVIAVAISRITLAMHYPADILYSAVVTIIVIITGNLLYASLRNIMIKPIGKLIIRLFFS